MQSIVFRTRDPTYEIVLNSRASGSRRRATRSVEGTCIQLDSPMWLKHRARRVRSMCDEAAVSARA